MAKREFIEPCEIVYTNAPIAPILQGDSVHYEDIAFKAQIGRIPTFTEQDIVKPYLDKLKKQAKENSVRWYVGRVDGKSDDVVLLEDLECLVDNLLSEQGDKNENKTKVNV